jgi:hypothetical protein
MQEESAYLSEVFKSSKAASATSFVRKLYTLVACESDEIVCFLPGEIFKITLYALLSPAVPDGSAFEVKDPKKLEAEVLPKYFRHSRFQSFVRQLNFYNFKKTNKVRGRIVPPISFRFAAIQSSLFLSGAVHVDLQARIVPSRQARSS